MVPPSLQAYFKQHNIAYEAIDTVCTVPRAASNRPDLLNCLLIVYCLQANAVSTFNILNQEGRKVAGVFLPAASN